MEIGVNVVAREGVATLNKSVELVHLLLVEHLWWGNGLLLLLMVNEVLLLLQMLLLQTLLLLQQFHVLWKRWLMEAGVLIV